MPNDVPMLSLHHSFSSTTFEVAFEQYEVRAPSFVAWRTRHAGGYFDESLESPPSRGAGWTRVVLVTEGELLAIEPDGRHRLGPGDAVMMPSWGALRMRALRPTTEIVNVAWAPTLGAPREAFVGALDRSSAGASMALAAMLAPAAGDEDEPRWGLEAPIATARSASAQRLVALLGTLGGTMGFSVAEEPLLAGLLAPTMAERRFARALGASIWPLRARPMIVDLCQALGCSERQVSRIASAYFRRYHLTVRGWRPFVHAFRLGIAVFLASTGRASAEAIAATVGFSSAVALHHAFSAAGLPTPRALSARDWSATDASGQASSGEIAARSPSGPPLARDRPASVAQRSARSCRMHS